MKSIILAGESLLASPRSCGGRRAQMLFAPSASFDLALRLRNGGAALGDIFRFFSGLYFRGKLAYAQRFARPPEKVSGVWIITPNRGLLPADIVISLKELRTFAKFDIHEKERRYRRPLARDAERLAVSIESDTVG